MRFEETYRGWQTGRLMQKEAAQLLGLCARSCRRHVDRYLDAGIDGLLDKLCWQKNSFWFCYKRLEADRFVWPRGNAAVVMLSVEQLHWLLMALIWPHCADITVAYFNARVERKKLVERAVVVL